MLGSSRAFRLPHLAPSRPAAEVLSHAGAERLCAFMHAHPRLFVLTGAGISEASGIPTYRDAEGRWTRTTPITHQEFIGSEHARRRYWARSMAGWPAVAHARPNAAHRALAALERAGHIAQVVTQNVDGLHQRAGSERVLDLHGRLDTVVCLDCGAARPRDAMQEELVAANPDFAHRPATLAPDGDAHVEEDCTRLVVPACPDCGGTLKPGVVFYGAGVPAMRVEAAYASLDAADAVLVVGSSLAVYSGYRFCVRASERGKPIAAVNLGRTRADALLAFKWQTDCGEALAACAHALGS